MSTVTTQEELLNAILAHEPQIQISNDILITTSISISYTLSISGNAGVSLFWANPTLQRRNMFIIEQNGDLTIESLTLDGQNKDGTLVAIRGGRLTIGNNTILKSIVSTTAQNAVQVGDLVEDYGGTFIMNGGLITAIDSADAVFCGGGSVFMNNDATISNNLSAGVTMCDTLVGGVRPKLVMGGQSKITNNISKQGASAGIMVQADIVMGVNEGDAPLVSGNSSPVYPVGGWLLIENTSLTMRYNAEISNNFSADYGGGIVCGQGSVVVMQENATIKNNISQAFGGGVALGNSSSLIMKDNAQIIANTCESEGGGVAILDGSSLKLSNYVQILENNAQRGKGVYQGGTLIISDSIRISDGLYFNGSSQTESPFLPTICGALSQDSLIKLEPSPYVALANVPLAIAKTDGQYTPLIDGDCSAWNIPSEFEQCSVVLNQTKDRVMIVLKIYYSITYQNLFDSTHENPLTYCESDLPITLKDPSARAGYTFKGWQNQQGEFVTSIDAGTSGDLILTAVWESDSLYLSFKSNLACSCNIPHPILAHNGRATIPNITPCSCCHRFICWNEPSSGSGKVYFAGDTIIIDKNTTLYAQWQPLYPCCCCNRGRR